MYAGCNCTFLPFFSTEELSACTLSTTPSAASISASIATYAAGLNNYLYAADEIDRCVSNSGFVSALAQWALNTHAAGSQTLVPAPPNPALYDDGNGRSIVDIWTMLPKMYSSAGTNVAGVLAKGNKIWLYNALVQDSFSPKWEVDFAPVNYRIMPGFDAQVFAFTGLLYSGVDNWTADPWNDLDNAQGGCHFNGEDILVYPGAQAAVARRVPPMRLEDRRSCV